jgi:hypothetical protein
MKVRTTYCPPTLTKPARILVVDVNSKNEKYFPVQKFRFPLGAMCKDAALEYFGDRYKGALSVYKDGEDYLFEVL